MSFMQGKLTMIASKNILVTVISTLVLVGCSSQFASSVRKVTYPPDFKYTEQAELRSNMHQLAMQMAILDKALVIGLDQVQNEPELQREQVLTALRNMGKIASNLNAGETGANHPFMDDYMKGFISEIDKAKTAASLQPPRYYFAGKISGGCAGCHNVNR
jgi:hypothetical protein